MDITFDQLPKAVSQLFHKLEDIERLLKERPQTQEPETERWLNLTELCAYLPDRPVKPTVYGWVHQRAIPCHRRGKKLYFLKSEIDTWLKTGRKKTMAEIAAEAQEFTPTKRK
jgi:excisionase family DNA binding protein